MDKLQQDAIIYVLKTLKEVLGITDNTPAIEQPQINNLKLGNMLRDAYIAGGKSTFTLEQIKAAYFAQWNESGESFFPYEGTPEGNLEITGLSWEWFVQELERTK